MTQGVGGGTSKAGVLPVNLQGAVSVNVVDGRGAVVVHVAMWSYR